jgi:hypothetical protein
MSFSLAKKNIKHKRKTMKRKQKGGTPSYFTKKREKSEVNRSGGNSIDRIAGHIGSSLYGFGSNLGIAGKKTQAVDNENITVKINDTPPAENAAINVASITATTEKKKSTKEEQTADKEATDARTIATKARKEYMMAKDIANSATKNVMEMEAEVANGGNITEWLKKRNLLKTGKGITTEDITTARSRVKDAQQLAITAAKKAKDNAEKLEEYANSKEQILLKKKEKNGSAANTIQMCTKDDTARKVKLKLQERNIKSFTALESANALNFNAAEYDKAASLLEKSNALLELVAPMLPPGTSQIISVSKALVLGIQKYNKQQELAYLSSECLSFVANISRDLAEMSAFYSNPIVREKKIIIDEALYEILVKNLFKFLYFLIDNIDFTNTTSGFYQYLFWYSFLSKIDFKKKTDTTTNNVVSPGKDDSPDGKDNVSSATVAVLASAINKNETISSRQATINETISSTPDIFSFSYSCDECMPNELREKLQYVSLKDKPYKGLIDLKGVGSSNKKKAPPKSNVGLQDQVSSTKVGGGLSLMASGANMISRAANSGANTVSSAANSGANMVSKAANSGANMISKAYSTANDKYMWARGRPDKDLYGFCGDDIVALCKNYNDIIMRLIEYNMYKLIVATYNNINFLPLIFKDVTKDEFTNYIFRNIDISPIDNSTIMDYETLRTTVTDYSDATPNTKATMCFNFLIQLKRIIEELDCGNIVPKANPNTTTYGYVSKGVNKLASFTSAYMGDPLVKYNTFLREYIIMTGNFATMISRYSLDHNRLSTQEKEEVVTAINKKIAGVEKGLEGLEAEVKSITDKAESQAAAAAEAADTAADAGRNGEQGEGEAVAGAGAGAVSGGKLIHNRLKKHTKKYKHYNDYKHYKSKKIRRNKRK